MSAAVIFGRTAGTAFGLNSRRQHMDSSNEPNPIQPIARVPKPDDRVQIGPLDC